MNTFKYIVFFLASGATGVHFAHAFANYDLGWAVFSLLLTLILGANYIKFNNNKP